MKSCRVLRLACLCLFSGALIACASATNGTRNALPVTPPGDSGGLVSRTAYLAAAPYGARGIVVPYHIATWAYDGGYSADNVAASDVARLVSYAEGSGKAVADCHSTSPPSCIAVMYFNPNMLYYSYHCRMDDAIISKAPESAFVHYASGAHRIGNSRINYCGGPTRTYFMNGNSSAWQEMMNARIHASDQYDAYYMDDTASSLQSLSSGGGGMCPEDHNAYDFCHTTKEYKSDADVVASRAALAHAMTHTDGRPAKMVYNGNISPALYTSAPSNYMGANVESSVVWADQGRPNRYELTLNFMQQVSKTSGFYILNSRGSGVLSARLIHSAVLLLGYSEGHTVSWEQFESGSSKLSIWPEALIYPTQPLQSMNGAATDLQVAPGVWRREFAGCFLAQKRFGPCAALLNANSHSVAINPKWFAQRYGHSVTFSGGDVLSGGATNLNAPLPGSIAPAGGLILAP